MIRRPPRSTQSRSSAASDVYKRQLYSHAPEHVSPMRGLLLRGASHEHFIPMRVALCRAGGSPCQRTSHCEDPTDAEQQLLTIVRRRVMTTWQFCAILYVPSWQQGDAPWTNRHDFCNG